MTRRLSFVALAMLPGALVLLMVAAGRSADAPRVPPPLPPSSPAVSRPLPLYHADPDHLWNRLHSALLVRTGPDGKDYGHDRLEPLLWAESDHLLTGPAADRLSALLQEFLRDKGETSIDNPLKRAILQRDLWLVANWMAGADNDQVAKRLAPLARVIRRLALTPEQIAALPDNYAAAVESRRFASRFDPDEPTRAYLPPELFKEDGPWVCVGRTHGLTAPQHLASPFSNSVFLVFVKVPGGREAGLAYVGDLARQKKPMLLPRIDAKTGRSGEPTFNPDTPPLPRGTELALVRRAMLIDAGGKVVASRLTESVQLRIIGIDAAAAPKELVLPTSRTDIDLRKMAVFEFQLRRVALFAGESGGLCDTSEAPDFKTGFATHGIDQFQQAGLTNGRANRFPGNEQDFSGRFTCFACHRSPTIQGTNAFQRHSPADEVLTDASPPLFPVAAVQPAEVARVAVKWKEAQKTWDSVRKALE